MRVQSSADDQPSDGTLLRSSDDIPWKSLAPADVIETCRAYLLMAANKGVGSELRVKVPPSDLVQETIIAAVLRFDQFQGSSERELLAWLTKILSYRIADAARKYGRQKADIGRELSIDDEAREIELSMSGVDGTPSAALMAEEEERRLRAAIAELDPDDEMIIRWRNWEDLKFAEIAARLGLSESGARRRWGQAIKELRRRLGS
ncbi:sigma-70 family RNA polymerase sigma factor [bacterium]|nr:sigma-70 family RNA polymerase sigma factor [bacterium]